MMPSTFGGRVQHVRSLDELSDVNLAEWTDFELLAAIHKGWFTHTVRGQRLLDREPSNVVIEAKRRGIYG